MTHSLGIMVFAKTSNNQGETMSHYKHLTPVEREKDISSSLSEQNINLYS